MALALAAGWTTDLRQHVGRMIVGVVLLVGLFLAFVLTTAVVQVLAKDFLVPIMALEGLDFAAGWDRLLAIIRPEKGRYAVYLLLKLVLSIAAAILFGIIAIIPVVFILVPAAVAVIAGHVAGLGWNVTTISLAIIFGADASGFAGLFDRSGKRTGHSFFPGVCHIFSSRTISESRRAIASRAHASGARTASSPRIPAALRSAAVTPVGGAHRLALLNGAPGVPARPPPHWAAKSPVAPLLPPSVVYGERRTGRMGSARVVTGLRPVR